MKTTFWLGVVPSLFTLTVIALSRLWAHRNRGDNNSHFS